MGWIKNAKASAMRTNAESAWKEDAVFFTPILNLPSTRPGMSGRVEDWELMLEAITSVGWKLEHWAVCSDDKGRPQAMPLFMR